MQSEGFTSALQLQRSASESKAEENVIQPKDTSYITQKDINLAHNPASPTNACNKLAISSPTRQDPRNNFNPSTTYPIQLPLSAVLMRNLGDRSYDKRKGAAMELENLIKQWQEMATAVERQQNSAACTLAESNMNPYKQQDNSPKNKVAPTTTAMPIPNISRQRIPAVIDLLGNDFACSTNANHRKGGLIGLAATAIGLMHEAHLYLNKLLPPVLHCFDDPESRVRYYACESLYNIAKVARGHILEYFNQIFDGLCKLFADVDVDVKNGANLLDRLVKDIVTESEYFDVDMFIPLLHKYIRMTNPYIRQLLVGWITVLDSVPDIDMLDWLPEFLDGLFNMLSDGNREIRQAADSALAEFLREIKQSPQVEYGRMVGILVQQCHSKERFNRLTAIIWVHEFVNLGREQLVSFYGDLLAAIMHCISDAEHEIRQVAERANEDLLSLVKDTNVEMKFVAFIQKLNYELVSDHVPTRMAALRWIAMLLEKDPTQMTSQITCFLSTLLKTLSDVSDSVVLLDLEVLARISMNKQEFEKVLNAILILFANDRRLLETRGSLIVRKLCLLLDAKRIYMIFAKVLMNMENMPEQTIASPSNISTSITETEILADAKQQTRITSVLDPIELRMQPLDQEFASVMIQTLNLILLTATELQSLRESLRKSCRHDATEQDIQVFTTLFQSWCYNPVAVFSLCLLAQAYSLSCALVGRFAEIDASVGFLMQIDKLVQLLESPIFIHVRLQLLEMHMDFHANLVKSLYGLLMLLPQSAAYRILRDRLASVTDMATTIGFGAKSSQTRNSDVAETQSDRQIDTQRFLDRFLHVQRHFMSRKRKV